MPSRKPKLKNLPRTPPPVPPPPRGYPSRDDLIPIHRPSTAPYAAARASYPTESLDRSALRLHDSTRPKDIFCPDRSISLEAASLSASYHGDIIADDIMARMAGTSLPSQSFDTRSEDLSPPPLVIMNSSSSLSLSNVIMNPAYSLRTSPGVATTTTTMGTHFTRTPSLQDNHHATSDGFGSSKGTSGYHHKGSMSLQRQRKSQSADALDSVPRSSKRTSAKNGENMGGNKIDAVKPILEAGQ